MTGQLLSHYRITAKIGAGGMGEVYRATDTKLERDVALKVLPPDTALDEARLSRFQREAKAVAALNHPNIVTIYSVEEAGGVHFLTMELVLGKGIDALLPARGFPVDRFFELAVPIADAVASAHARGIVHRDLKPANVMVTDEGARVKVLDFGLAKLAESGAREGPGDLPTLALTQHGLVMGTPHYMSPEQARGVAVDHRSDIFSLGVMFFEMLTGRRPFEGTSAIELMSAILKDPAPAVSDRRSGLPRHLGRVIGRCLEKAPEDRYQTARDVFNELRALREETSSRAPERRAPTAVAGVESGEGRRPDRRGGFVGRDAERSRLGEMLKRAKQGRGGLVLLGGEPGVGKTRLASEILADGRERGMLALTGHAYEDETAPFVTSTEILEEMVRVLPAGALRQMLGPNASELSRLLPGLRQLYPDIAEPAAMPPELQQRHLFKHVLEFLTRAAAEQPLVMLLDDLHWADESSMLLLQHVAPRLAELPILMIGTYRDVEADVGKPFSRAMATLVRQRLVDRITVKPFDEGSVADILTTLGGSAPPAGLAHAIYGATEGNVFFVEETFRHLSEEGKLFDDQGAWRADIDVAHLDVPEGVRLVTARRLERLPEPTRKVLSVASVIGLRFAVPVLEAAAPDAEAVLDALEQAEAAHLLKPSVGGRELRYEFVHALARQTLLGQISPLRRQRMHLAVADAIEKTAGTRPEGHAADIAHHLVEAGSSADRERAIRWLRTAGENAASAAALEEAFRYFDTALAVETEQPSENRGDLLQRKAWARMALGDAKGCQSDLADAIAVYEVLGAKTKAAGAMAGLGNLLVQTARPTDALAVVERARAFVGGGDSPERSRLLSTQGFALSMTQDPHEAEACHEAAVAMARRLQDRGLLADVLQARAFSDQFRLIGDRLVERAKEAAALRRELGQPFEEAYCLFCLMNGLTNSGRYDEAARVGDELLPLAERQGVFGAMAMAYLLRASADVARGDVEGVQASLRLSTQFFETGGFPYGRDNDGHALSVLILAGKHELARPVLDRVATAGFPEGQAWTGQLEGYSLAAKAYLGDGDVLPMYDRYRSRLPRPGLAMSGGSVLFLAWAIEALAVAGERVEAGKLYPLIAEFVGSELGLYAFTSGLLERFAGVAAAAARDWANAERHFRHSLQVVDDEFPHRVDQARVRYWYARMLLDRGGPGDAGRARELLAEARGLSQGIGLHGLLRWIDALEAEASTDLSPVAGSGAGEKRATERGGTFVGRDRERSTLNEMLERARQGHGALVVLGGEPGVGKTRLAAEILEDGRERGMLALTGHAYEDETAPFVLVSEILDEMVRLVPKDRMRALLGDDASELSRLLPALRKHFADIPVPDELPPEQQQRVLFRSILDLLERASARTPVVMLLDDVHWADESSLKLLGHVAQRLGELPIAVIGTYRDAETEMSEAFRKTLADLVRRRQVERLPIKNFDRQAVGGLLAARGGSAPPEALAAAIHQGTEGNAFFVEEVFRHLSEEGVLFDDEGHWRDGLDAAALDVPDGVRLVTGRRLERLQANTRAVLTTAAGIGLRFELGVLEAAVGDADRALDGVEEAEAAQLLIASPGRREVGYEFAHALVRQTLLESLSVPRRQRLHLSIAVAMEAAWGEGAADRAAEIAHQLESAGGRAPAARTRRFLTLAGAQALERAAAEEGREYFDRALALAEDATPDERGHILYRRGMALRTLSRWDEAATDWDAALPLLEAAGEAELVATICSERGWQFTWALNPVPALGFIERGLRAVGDRVDAQRCRLLALESQLRGQAGDFPGGAESSRAANAMAQQLGDPGLLAGHVMLHDIYRCEHYFLSREAAALSDAAIALVRVHGSPFQLTSMLSASTQAYFPNARWDSLLANRHEALRLAIEHGDIGGHFNAHAYTGLLMAFRGEIDAGLDRMERALDRTYVTPIDSLVDAMKCMPQLWRGAWEEADALSARAFANASNRDVWEGGEAACRVKVLATLGRESAVALLDDVERLLPEPGRPNPGGKWYIGLASIEAAALLGLLDRAAALHPAAVQLVDQGTFCTVLGFAERFAGIAAAAGGDWDAADEHFAKVEALATALGARVELAETWRWQAQGALWRGGAESQERAGALRARAASLYAEIGMHRHAAIVQGAD